MRIVVDLQGAQAVNAQRGIGGYSLSLVEHLVDQAGGHEIVLALNGAFADEADLLRERFGPAVGDERIQVWYPPGQIRGAAADDPWTRRAAERVRDAFIESLDPDVVLVTSLFEGFRDGAVTSVPGGAGAPTAIVLYDLIPLVRRADYLSDPSVERWYERCIGQLRRADLLLAISEASRVEAIDWLDADPDAAINISAGVRSVFSPGDVEPRIARKLQQRFRLDRPFALYTGGIDPRKNIDGLIDAFAAMPIEVRSAHQLAVVCSIEPATRTALEQRCALLGLGQTDVVFTGFVSESDLVALCRLATAAVVPSLHEGFGLPALEAMSCGRAVIASNRSSLPEVVGRDDALFDPTSTESIASLLERVLTDGSYRADLEQHALEQAARFSWDRTAAMALEALEQLHAAHTTGSPAAATTRTRRPSMAMLTPMPPEQSGISDYSALLLPHLSRRYDIDLITDLPEITDQWAVANCGIRSIEWFRRHHHRYDRVVYHMGNSSFHGHMFDLLADVPGIVVLHDFALSGIVSYRDSLGEAAEPWHADLYRSHGYVALVDDAHTPDRSDMVWRYPVNLHVLQQAMGTIVHSETARLLAEQWYGPRAADRWQVVPMPRSAAGAPDRASARAHLGLPHHDIVVCAFGILARTKLNHRLIDAWAQSTLSRDRSCRLVFVGENSDLAYATELEESIRSQSLNNVSITGRVDAAGYLRHLAAADIGVQLRARSRGETSASAFDCLAHGLATIVNANGSLAEIPADAVVRLDDEFTTDALVDALERLRRDADQRVRLGEAGRTVVRDGHGPRIAGEAMADAIERLWAHPTNRRPRIADAIRASAGTPTDVAAVRAVAISATRSLSVSPRQRHLFLDVSELNIRDAGSGIQRVTRNLVRTLVTDPPPGWRVEPIAATNEDEYRFARRFTSGLLGLETELTDEGVDYAPGDLFVGVDLQPQSVPSHRGFFRRLQRAGVDVAFVVYDLLPIIAPENFYPGAAELYERWLAAVREADALIAISRSVRDDLEQWLQAHPSTAHDPALGWFHLGADLDGMSADELQADGAARAGAARFLMVGTIEPRKRHRQVLDAFEILWDRGVTTELVIVGRHGWMMDDFVDRLRAHPRAGSLLHWFEGADDETLAGLYRSSAALVAASVGEGFGLPLIEAAKFGLPIIARDLPVFREVAGEHAVYFSGDAPGDIAGALEQWLARRRIGEVPASVGMTWNTWQASADQLMSALRAALDGPR